MRRALLFVLIGALLSAAPAAAVDYTVLAGEPNRRGAPEEATQNRFLPENLRISTGDRVTWNSPASVHTVSFLGPRSPAGFPFIRRDPEGSTYSGINDFAAAPFYFNGLRKWIYDLSPLLPRGSTTVANRKVHSSFVGKDVGKPRLTFSFTKPGTYKYVCLLHPGMDGKVVVRGAAARRFSVVDNPTEVEARALRDVKAGWALARSLKKVVPPVNTVYAGIERQGVHSYIILPDVLTVKKGTTVNIVAKATSDGHSFGLGPESWIKSFLKATDIFPDNPGDPSQVAPVHILGSDPAPLTYDGANHGNGFLAAPSVDAAKATPPPASTQVTFATVGEFTYYCLIHFPDMKAKIVVTE